MVALIVTGPPVSGGCDAGTSGSRKTKVWHSAESRLQRCGKPDESLRPRSAPHAVAREPLEFRRLLRKGYIMAEPDYVTYPFGAGSCQSVLSQLLTPGKPCSYIRAPS
jgi:hypothetical protein